MKRFIAAVAASALLFSLASASTILDFSDFTIDELFEIRFAAGYWLFHKGASKHVTIPVGLWKIGDDIPAGRYIITATDGFSSVIKCGTTLDPTGNDLEYPYNLGGVRSPSCTYSLTHDPEFVVWNLNKGSYFVVLSSPVKISPWSGFDFSN